MPHQRERYIRPLITRALTHSPIVGLLGQRQTGKTTLIKDLGADYVTLDRREMLDRAQDDAQDFVEGHKSPFAIDECQLAPALFPALKESVRLRPAKGRFLLSGSVRFTSRQAIRESLTGRIYNLELLPLSLSEAEGRALPDALLKWSPADLADLKSPLSDHRIQSTLESGGLPGICFFRDPAVRAGLLSTHLETLLERDLKLIIQTSLSYSTLRTLAELLALEQGQPLELAALSRKSSISVPTVKKLLAALEGLFLIRQLRQEGTGSKAPVYFFEDQGQATHLAQNRFGRLEQLTRFLYMQLSPQFHYRPEQNAVLFQYRSRGGAYVPLAWRTRKRTLGVIPSLDETPSRAALQSARSFVKFYEAADQLAQVAIVYPGRRAKRIDRSIGTLPLSRIV